VNKNLNRRSFEALKKEATVGTIKDAICDATIVSHEHLADKWLPITNTYFIPLFVVRHTESPFQETSTFTCFFMFSSQLSPAGGGLNCWTCFVCRLFIVTAPSGIYFSSESAFWLDKISIPGTKKRVVNWL